MPELISAWECGPLRFSVLERMDDGRRKMRAIKSRYSLFLDTENIHHQRLIEISRDPDLTMSGSGRFVRIDATPRKPRGRGQRREWPGSVRKRLRESFRVEFGDDAVREADVDPIRRWIADNQGVKISADPTICFMDLEAQSPGKTIDDAREGMSRILSFAAEGSDDQMLAEILFENDPRTGPEISDEEMDAAERRMIIRLLRFMRRYDVVVAWYGGDVRPGTGFDFDCLRNRAERLGIHLPEVFANRDGSPRLDMSWESWVWADQMEICKKYAASEEKWNLSLNGFAAAVGITEGKVAFDAAKVYETWALGPEGRELVLRYNIQDTALLRQIEDRCKYLALHFGVCTLCNQIPHTRALRATQQADGYLLRYAGLRGYRWASNWWGDDPPEDDVEGAFVFPVKRPGLHTHVNVGDFSGLYPSIMRTWNIGPDTVVDASFEGPRCKAPLIDGRFRTDVDSFFRRALSDLITNRAQYKGELKNHTPGSREYAQLNNLSQAAKIVANSFYGVLLCKHYRFFDAVAGHAVTSTGQWLIQTVAKDLEGAGLGWEVIGGDTDSVFVWTREDCITPRGSDELYTPMGKRFISEIDSINSRWPELVSRLGCGESFINLEWEQSFKRAVFLKKKMYFGTSHFMDGKRPKKPWKHKIRGIALRRGDRTGLAKAMLGELLEKLIGRESVPELLPVPSSQELDSWRAIWRERVVNGTLDEGDVIMVQSIRKSIQRYYSEAAFKSQKCRECGHKFPSKKGVDEPRCPRCGTPRERMSPGAHVRIAKRLADRGESPMVGDKIRYVYTWQPEKNQDKWVPEEAGPEWMSRLDRAQYWFGAWSPSESVLRITHPDHPWPSPTRERNQLYREARQEYSRETAQTAGIWGMMSDPGAFLG